MKITKSFLLSTNKQVFTGAISVIITRYLVWETVKSQLAILFILLLVFLCQKLGQLLGTVVEGDIPLNVVLALLGLSLPAMVQLILPLSLFLGVLVILSRMYAANEITVIYACGFGKSILIRVALLLSLMNAIVAAVNVIWLSPGLSRYQAIVISDAKVNLSTAAGQFKLADNGNLVLFVGKVQDTVFEHIFMAKIKPNCHARPFVIMADRGHMTKLSDGSQILMLDNGTSYEGTALLRDFCITSFAKYQALIGSRSVANSIETKQMTMHQLWHSSEPEARAEFHWRLTLVVSVLIMTIMVVPLSVVNQRQQSIVLRILPAMLLYLLFFLLQITLRYHSAKGKLDPMFWLWLTNVLFLVLGLILNVLDTVPIRRLRGWLLPKGAPSC
ncbi:putative permease, YjgP/YjgQ family [Candidatus Moranella endobia PCIT]|uniref:Lipopolysaccharide export system permease protein LptF n=1 Tax=Moranella endobia (strain PCIT) TaxID=903503 RepID=F7XY86_MOREP|nr:putative permease, YjgP/YjgQ family [Candidatus Moranella endobia PCIT]